ncbi:hypothetical protein [Rhizohabitans arisaemae]|uniref:hypothetical protein n=1 Tax=Rhizohabitans arisaemae TaxID=2720610 RepID=UPI0024B07001|nr:hypothetical protein [Rhizohabitans arisaemae]
MNSRLDLDAELELRARVRRTRLFSGFPLETLIRLVLLPEWTTALARHFELTAPGDLPDLLRRLVDGELVETSPILTPDGEEDTSFWVHTSMRTEIGEFIRLTAHPHTVNTTLLDMYRRAKAQPDLANWRHAVNVHLSDQSGASLLKAVTPLIESGRIPEAARQVAVARMLGDVLRGPLPSAARRAQWRVNRAMREAEDARFLRHYLPRATARRALNELFPVIRVGIPGESSDFIHTPQPTTAPSSNRWALHLLGGGGAGKTMVVRHLSSGAYARERGLAPFPVARIDFDHMDPRYPDERPGEMLLALAEELLGFGTTRSMEHSYLRFTDTVDHLHEELSRAEHLTDRIGSLTYEMIAGFARFVSALPPPVTLVLDTCEELAKLYPVGADAPAIDKTFHILETLHELVPSLRVVFAGRRRLVPTSDPGDSAGPLLRPRPYLRVVPFGGFTAEEAHDYLTARAPTPALRPALLDRSRDGELHNPFELAAYTEWALSEPDLDPDALRNAPRDPYIERRIVARLDDPQLTRSLAVAAELGRFDRNLIAPALRRLRLDPDHVFDGLATQEWVRVVELRTDGRPRVIELDENLGTRLRAFTRADPDRFPLNPALLGEDAVQVIDGTRMLRDVPTATVVTAVRLLPVETAGTFWKRLEERIIAEDAWAWAAHIAVRAAAEEQQRAPGPANTAPAEREPSASHLPAAPAVGPASGQAHPEGTAGAGPADSAPPGEHHRDFAARTGPEIPLFHVTPQAGVDDESLPAPEADSASQATDSGSQTHSILAAILATQAAARIHTEAAGVLQVWQEVARHASRHPDPVEATALADRAFLGRAAAGEDVPLDEHLVEIVARGAAPAGSIVAAVDGWISHGDGRRLPEEALATLLERRRRTEGISRPTSRQPSGLLLRHQTRGIERIAVAPDSTWLAATGMRRVTHLWNIDGSHRAALSQEEPITRLAIAPDGGWLATTDGRNVRLWLGDGSRGATLQGSSGQIIKIAIAPDSTWLATTDNQGEVRLFGSDGSLRQVVTHHTGPVKKIAIAPDGTWLATGDETTVHLWNADGTARATLAGHDRWLRRVVISPDGSWLATSDELTVRLYENSGRLRTTFLGRLKRGAVAPDGTWLAVTGEDNLTRLWNSDGSPRAVLESGRVTGIAIAPDGTWLATTGPDRTARLWESDGTLRTTLPVRVHKLAISPDGTWLATSHKDQAARLWFPSGASKATLSGHHNPIDVIAIAPDATWLATTGEDEEIRLWRSDLDDMTITVLTQRSIAALQHGDHMEAAKLADDAAKLSLIDLPSTKWADWRPSRPFISRSQTTQLFVSLVSGTPTPEFAPILFPAPGEPGASAQTPLLHSLRLRVDKGHQAVSAEELRRVEQADRHPLDRGSATWLSQWIRPLVVELAEAWHLAGNPQRAADLLTRRIEEAVAAGDDPTTVEQCQLALLRLCRRERNLALFPEARSLATTGTPMVRAEAWLALTLVKGDRPESPEEAGSWSGWWRCQDSASLLETLWLPPVSPEPGIPAELTAELVAELLELDTGDHAIPRGFVLSSEGPNLEAARSLDAIALQWNPFRPGPNPLRDGTPGGQGRELLDRADADMLRHLFRALRMLNEAIPLLKQAQDRTSELQAGILSGLIAMRISRPGGSSQLAASRLVQYSRYADDATFPDGSGWQERAAKLRGLIHDPLQVIEGDLSPELRADTWSTVKAEHREGSSNAGSAVSPGIPISQHDPYATTWRFPSAESGTIPSRSDRRPQARPPVGNPTVESGSPQPRSEIRHPPATPADQPGPPRETVTGGFEWPFDSRPPIGETRFSSPAVDFGPPVGRSTGNQVRDDSPSDLRIIANWIRGLFSPRVIAWCLTGLALGIALASTVLLLTVGPLTTTEVSTDGESVGIGPSWYLTWIALLAGAVPGGYLLVHSPIWSRILARFTRAVTVEVHRHTSSQVSLVFASRGGASEWGPDWSGRLARLLPPLPSPLDETMSPLRAASTRLVRFLVSRLRMSPRFLAESTLGDLQAAGRLPAEVPAVRTVRLRLPPDQEGQPWEIWLSALNDHKDVPWAPGVFRDTQDRGHPLHGGIWPSIWPLRRRSDEPTRERITSTHIDFTTLGPPRWRAAHLIATPVNTSAGWRLRVDLETGSGSKARMNELVSARELEPQRQALIILQAQPVDGPPQRLDEQRAGFIGFARNLMEYGAGAVIVIPPLPDRLGVKAALLVYRHAVAERRAPRPNRLLRTQAMVRTLIENATTDLGGTDTNAYDVLLLLRTTSHFPLGTRSRTIGLDY